MALSGKSYSTSGTTLVHTGPITFGGINYRNTTAATDVIITVFDSLTATGTILFQVGPLTAAGTAGSLATVAFPASVRANIGVTVLIQGTTPTINGAVWLD
jgi:hypothetical protein